MKKKTKYIHYCRELLYSPRFDKECFKPIRNEYYISTKPKGGLWASSVEAKFGWKDWCEQNEFRRCMEDNSFTFILTENANIVHIYSTHDLESLPRCYEQLGINSLFYNIDFEKCLQDGIDAIELHLSEEKFDKHKDESYFERGLYYKLYGWDCDSILIMNPDIVQELQ